MTGTMKNRWLVLILCLMIGGSLLLIGCGASDEEAEVPPRDEAEPEEAPETEDTDEIAFPLVSSHDNMVDLIGLFSVLEYLDSQLGWHLRYELEDVEPVDGEDAHRIRIIAKFLETTFEIDGETVTVPPAAEDGEWVIWLNDDGKALRVIKNGDEGDPDAFGGLEFAALEVTGPFMHGIQGMSTLASMTLMMLEGVVTADLPPGTERPEMTLESAQRSFPSVTLEVQRLSYTYEGKYGWMEWFSVGDHVQMTHLGGTDEGEEKTMWEIVDIQLR